MLDADYQKEVEELKLEVAEMSDLEAFMLSSENVQKAVLHGLVRSVAKADVNVLLTGESGTGKELTARVIHQLSTRSKGPFVAIDCAAIPETLIEGELFGHEKGSFTGADATLQGKLETANGGTLFLDEVSNIPTSVQAKLLRFLESREFERIGGRKSIRTDIRIIAATNTDLEELAKEKKFRMDLFYRLNEFPISIPPLRERREDIPMLSNRFLVKFQDAIQHKVVEISPTAMQKLQAYHYPGNVRELRNVIKRAMVVAKNQIEVNDLPVEVQKAQVGPKKIDPEIHVPILGEVSLPDAVRKKAQETERQMIIDALKKTGGHHGKAAELLGITSRTLYNKMRDLGL
ncbi:MAG: sigma 54-interacting transcriptional regulator [Deltaproteobacteria bacterium]|nr:sigma 54-interacting transcriptional regulator [Deltaproteobacteria bacterium]MBI4196626.1 sigma 54-interacting transcriptional regulator [Deltaproteobacteria bacterium]